MHTFDMQALHTALDEVRRTRPKLGATHSGYQQTLQRHDLDTHQRKHDKEYIEEEFCNKHRSASGSAMARSPT
jgi:hypothetical protein